MACSALIFAGPNDGPVGQHRGAVTVNRHLSTVFNSRPVVIVTYSPGHQAEIIIQAQIGWMIEIIRQHSHNFLFYRIDL